MNTIEIEVINPDRTVIKIPLDILKKMVWQVEDSGSKRVDIMIYNDTDGKGVIYDPITS